MRLALDEMYPPALAQESRGAGLDALTVAEFGLAGSSDPDVFAAAVAQRRGLLTENVADFARIAADHLTRGGHHPGVLIAALSSRFSRPPAGRPTLVAALLAVVGEPLDDHVVYLRRGEGA